MIENKHKKNYFRTKRFQWIIIVIAILVYISFYIPVPYFITMPGSAIELTPLVDIQNSYKQEGKLMLTTVSLMPARFPTYIYSQFNSYMETIPKEYLINENEDSEDYANRQIKVMKESQDNATIAAFHYLGLPIDINNKGVLVMGLIAGAPSEHLLKIGDLITNIDDHPINSVNDLLNYLKNKKEGEVVQVNFMRSKKMLTENIPLVALTESTLNGSTEKVGIGFYPYQEREVSTSKKVDFHTENIGGPSAGLMFTLQIINKLTPEDLTHGYKIAGTGTIDENGNVGQIGGARLKVKAAYKAGATIFFVPKDVHQEDINQKEAIQSNEDLDNPLTIVPVLNVSDAVNYLKRLK